ncbi:MAG: LptA/OstA family protein [Alphaproteobacteria bacterium]
MSTVMTAVLAATGLLVGSLSATTAGAQGVGSGIEIEASQSLEWHSDQNIYVARGDARLRQGDFVVTADLLTADYRDRADGTTEIWRVTADGSVVVTTPTEQAHGDHGVYDIDKDVFTLTGDDLKLVTETEVITARDSLEYWQGEQLAVARGDAQAVRGTDRVNADELTAVFVENDAGKLEMRSLNAFGNVVITTTTDVASGDQGVYDLVTNVATLTGSVRLTRGKNQLNGDYAEINLTTGVSRLLAQPGADDRVHGLFVPSE